MSESTTKRLRIVAVTSVSSDGVGRGRILVDKPLETVEDLALLQPVSPMSRMLQDGAGMEYRPKAVLAYLDGKLIWEKSAGKSGRTDHDGNRKRAVKVKSCDPETVRKVAERMQRDRECPVDA